jgi:hypothetical protein
MTALALRVRRDLDQVEAAVIAAADRCPPGWPVPQLDGRVIRVPGLPEPVELLYQEFLARRLTTLAARLVDPVRWGRVR